jgi:oligoendopeptidase F
MSVAQEIFPRKVRSFVPQALVVSEWSEIEPLVQRLLDAPLDTVEEVEAWLLNSCELEAIVNEEGAWRYIRMTCDTNSKELRQKYDQFISDIVPKLSVKANEIHRKLYDAPGFAALDKDKYKVLIRSIINRIELFREANIPLVTEMRKRSREFDSLASGISIENEGVQMTLQKAASLLELKDRDLRERIWRKITGARLVFRDQLNALYSDLLQLRSQVATNAGFRSYTDYKFMELGRFDYTREDTLAFHNAVERIVTPELVRRSKERASKLGVDVLRPWDLAVDETGLPPLTPFKSTDELTERVIRMFDRLDPRIGANISTMRRMGHLDLDSRMGKAPGGYNYSLPETGVPFIFMNAVGTQGDIVVMLHECGHAIHSFAIRNIGVSEFKQLPAEIAELASMSMELIGLDFLDEVYDNPDDIRRAKREQILRPITLLPWIASIDSFQLWTHDNPGHTVQEREAEWEKIFRRFHGDYVSWEGHEEVLRSFWQKQGHVFEVPFYYIEYGIAQLAAIAVWRNYRLNPEKGLQSYLDALALGYSKSIPEVYAAAGVKFDFSEAYVRELFDFMMEELKAGNS